MSLANLICRVMRALTVPVGISGTKALHHSAPFTPHSSRSWRANPIPIHLQHFKQSAAAPKNSSHNARTDSGPVQSAQGAALPASISVGTPDSGDETVSLREIVLPDDRGVLLTPCRGLLVRTAACREDYQRAQQQRRLDDRRESPQERSFTLEPRLVNGCRFSNCAKSTSRPSPGRSGSAMTPFFCTG